MGCCVLDVHAHASMQGLHLLALLPSVELRLSTIVALYPALYDVENITGWWA